MNKLFDSIADWLPFILLLIWFGIDSLWEAYSRRKNYDELKILNELREKGIITQEEFDEKKQLLF